MKEITFELSLEGRKVQPVIKKKKCMKQWENIYKVMKV